MQIKHINVSKEMTWIKLVRLINICRIHANCLRIESYGSAFQEILSKTKWKIDFFLEVRKKRKDTFLLIVNPVGKFALQLTCSNLVAL